VAAVLCFYEAINTCVKCLILFDDCIDENEPFTAWSLCCNLMILSLWSHDGIELSMNE